MKYYITTLFIFVSFFIQADHPVLDNGRVRPSSVSDSTLTLPQKDGSWKSLDANTSIYPTPLLKEIQSAENQAVQDQKLWEAYETIAGTPMVKSSVKTLYYPTTQQIKAETLYFNVPWIIICIALYLLGLFWTPFGIAGFLLHTFILGLRCYILSRAPVTNMFETILYVPWITVIAGFITQKLKPGFFVAIILLSLIKAARIDHSLENVQAVLDSQFWLIIHVLMVVGSYGLFLLSGILGHLYLMKPSKKTSDSLLQALYGGVALLIPGTILGGVWAAQSWGRFWDWDPKESWAFISACTYLVIIHAYRYRHIHEKGLAIGSIIGLIVISFTWYGVNYILGTGLHSYGFGSGGEVWYYLYIVAELLFIGYFGRQRLLNN